MPAETLPPNPSRPQWQKEIAEAITDPNQLLKTLGLGAGPIAEEMQVILRGFPLRVPRPYLRRIRPGDPDDPLLRQILPLPQEALETPGFCTDPVGDQNALAAPGLITKYRGRALLITTAACAIHCRYCFRRHFPYHETHVCGQNWHTALDHLRSQPETIEVILSGGDPLSLNDRRLRAMAEDISAIPHIRYLRIHSRLPVVIPSRIDERLLGWLGENPLRKIMVIHVNHSNEMDDEVDRALGRLKDAGVTLLNQSVLLRGVNDRLDALMDLSERLFAAGVTPYYLHLLDRVSGASHFELPEHAAMSLHRQLRARLPGYLVPRLVRDRPDSDFKQILG